MSGAQLKRIIKSLDSTIDVSGETTGQITLPIAYIVVDIGNHYYNKETELLEFDFSNETLKIKETDRLLKSKFSEVYIGFDNIFEIRVE